MNASRKGRRTEENHRHHDFPLRVVRFFCAEREAGAWKDPEPLFKTDPG
jgi:hypothetical protein